MVSEEGIGDHRQPERQIGQCPVVGREFVVRTASRLGSMKVSPLSRRRSSRSPKTVMMGAWGGLGGQVVQAHGRDQRIV